MTNEKQNIAFSAKPMVTKSCWIVAYDEGISPTMSQDLLTPWSRQVTWQIKNLTCSIPHSL